MKIEGLPIQAQRAHGPQSQQPPAPTGGQTVATGNASERPSIVVDISEEAAAAARGLGGTGKSRAPGQVAKAMMEEYRELGQSFNGKNFGQLVSQIARGLDPEALFATPPSEPDEGDAPTAGDAVMAGEGEPVVGEDDGTAAAVVAGEDGDGEPIAPVDPDLSLAEALLEATAEDAEEVTDASLIETLLEELDTTA